MTQTVQYSPANTVDKHILITAGDVCGATITVARRNLEYEDAQDEYLFEPDYTIAGSTGFLLWPGSLVLVDLLRGQLGERISGKRLVELGAGTGLAGLCASAAGAHVLMTDLPSVVHGILDRNVTKNALQNDTQQPIVSCSSSSATQGPWAGAVPVGLRGGSAGCIPLDWSQPLEPQLASAASKCIDFTSMDMLIACDVVWLKELLLPFRDTVLELLRRCRPGTPCLLTFLDRAKAGSGNFSSRAEVLGLFEEQGCSIQVCHSQAVEVDGEQLMAEVIEICLKHS